MLRGLWLRHGQLSRRKILINGLKCDTSDAVTVYVWMYFDWLLDDVGQPFENPLDIKWNVECFSMLLFSKVRMRLPSTDSVHDHVL